VDENCVRERRGVDVGSDACARVAARAADRQQERISSAVGGRVAQRVAQRGRCRVFAHGRGDSRLGGERRLHGWLLRGGVARDAILEHDVLVRGRAGEDGGDLGRSGELVEDGAVNVELPVEVRAHLALIWLTSRSANMPWPTMDQDLFEYMSSQMTLDAIMNADRKRRWPNEPRAAGKQWRCWRRNSAAKVTKFADRVRCKA
jgi:hypothetical protein